MQDTLAKLQEHGSLVRFKGGFWSWKCCEINHYRDYSCPEWHCDVKTLRALEKRGLVELDEQQRLCKLVN